VPFPLPGNACHRTGEANVNRMSEASPNPACVQCPVPLTGQAEIKWPMAAVGGSRSRLIDGVFAPAFRNAALDARHDGALLPAPPPGTRLAFTTDSHVVSPLFFRAATSARSPCMARSTISPCAAHGRSGSARASFWKKGCRLRRSNAWWRRWVRRRGLPAWKIVTGDTKVVERGKGDGLYVNTAGVGWMEQGLTIAPTSCGRATPSCSAAMWAATAWRFSRSARGWRSNRPSRAIPRRCGRRWRRCWRRASRCIVCAI